MDGQTERYADMSTLSYAEALKMNSKSEVITGTGTTNKQCNLCLPLFSNQLQFSASVSSVPQLHHCKHCAKALKIHTQMEQKH